jgi:hypothetical protein
LSWAITAGSGFLDEVSFSGAPSIIVPPSARAVWEGEAVVFDVEPWGTPPLEYQWQFQGVDLSEGNGATGVTSRILTISNPTAAQVGEYRVIISNAEGSVTSAPVRLDLRLGNPWFAEQPQTIITNLGSTISFSASVRGTPPLFYQWRFNGHDLTNADGVSGATNAQLTLVNVQPELEGVYSLVVSNSLGVAVSGSAELAIVVP